MKNANERLDDHKQAYLSGEKTLNQIRMEEDRIIREREPERTATNYRVTKEQVQGIMDNAEYEVFHKVFGKQCLVVAKLPNGFTVVGESACVDPSNYDEEIGFNIAKSRIENKIWELEGYKLQNTFA